MTNLAKAIAYEAAYQELLRRAGYRVTREWCMGSVAFLVGCATPPH